jgi:hypothetical protein
MPCEYGSQPYYRPVAPQSICEPFQLDCPKYDDNGCRVPPELIVDVKKFTGTYTDIIPARDLQKLISFEDKSWHCNCGNSLKLSAEVTDKYSGEKLSGEAKLRVEQKRYKVNFVYTPDSPRSDMPFEFIARAQYIDDSVLDVDGTAKCIFTVYRDEDVKTDFPAALTSDGYFKCTVPESLVSIENFQVEAAFDDNLNEGELSTASTRHYYYKPRQTTEEYLQIKTDVNDRKLLPGEHTG